MAKSAVMTISAPAGLIKKVAKKAKDHEVNRSWLGRFYVKYAYEHVTEEELLAAIKKDPKSHERIISRKKSDGATKKKAQKK